MAVLARETNKDLLAEGYKTRYGISDEYNKPKTHLDAISANTGGGFTNWATGETDFQVLDVASGKSLVDKMGLILDDSNFETVFREFRNNLSL